MDAVCGSGCTLVQAIQDGQQSNFTMVLTPKKLHMLGRFLGKVGLGLLGLSDSTRARDPRFDQVRRYARYGEFRGIWPIFHYTQGELHELRQPVVRASGGDAFEEVQLYCYELVELAERYTLFRFQMGVDHWIICLDDPFPDPILRKAFPGTTLNLIWYEETEWKADKGGPAPR